MLQNEIHKENKQQQKINKKNKTVFLNVQSTYVTVCMMPTPWRATVDLCWN